MERFPSAAPDPISAIVFRMTELGLKKKDLGEIIGSQPRATEVLSRSRQLTLEMIRKIHTALRIPAEVLIAKDSEGGSPGQTLNPQAFPVKEMVKRGWLDKHLVETDPDAAVQRFLASISGDFLPVFLRRSVHGQASGYSREKLYAWLARVVFRGRESRASLKKYEKGSVTLDLITDIAKLSASSKGPLIAKDYLARRGIALVIEPALPGTNVDGAAVADKDGTPIIGISVRHDRIDSFWFTLAHELAHVALHLDKYSATFVDDTDSTSEDDVLEQEANAHASEALIPQSIWRYSAAARSRDAESVRLLAQELCIHEAIVAGRIRRESGNYRILHSLLGSGEVRKLFTDTSWS